MFIVDFLVEMYKDRNNKENKNRTWPEYWLEKKRLWTCPEEWKKLVSWTFWKSELKKKFKRG
jgi:hypothetical protein|tara:strand:- start:431 stop:616 length:186 start_codon:yes stop_codon:yes gene_type:complete